MLAEGDDPAACVAENVSVVKLGKVKVASIVVPATLLAKLDVSLRTLLEAIAKIKV